MQVFKELATINEKIEHVKEAQKYLLFTEFGEQSSEARERMKRQNNKIAKIYSEIEEVLSELQDELLKIVRKFKDSNGHKETAKMLYTLKRWHPWSYKTFFEILTLLRQSNDQDLLASYENCERNPSLYGVKFV